MLNTQGFLVIKTASNAIQVYVIKGLYGCHVAFWTQPNNKELPTRFMTTSKFKMEEYDIWTLDRSTPELESVDARCRPSIIP